MCTVLSRVSTHGCSQLKHQNLRVGGYTEKVLKQINYISMQGPTPDAKLDAMGPNRLASFIRPCFIEASPTVEKKVSCYRADQLVASLLNFCSVEPSLVVRKFHDAGEEHCERGHGQVCANL